MIDDMRHFKAESDDPFQLLSGDACVMIFCVLVFGLIVFKDFIR